MNPRSCDRLSRSLVASAPRRSVLGRLAAVAAGIGAAVPALRAGAETPPRCVGVETLWRTRSLRRPAAVRAASVGLGAEKKKKKTISRAACACLNGAYYVFGQVDLICAVVADGNATVEEACVDDAAPCLDLYASCRNGDSCIDAWADAWLGEE